MIVATVYRRQLLLFLVLLISFKKSHGKPGIILDKVGSILDPLGIFHKDAAAATATATANAQSTVLNNNFHLGPLGFSTSLTHATADAKATANGNGNAQASANANANANAIGGNTNANANAKATAGGINGGGSYTGNQGPYYNNNNGNAGYSGYNGYNGYTTGGSLNSANSESSAHVDNNGKTYTNSNTKTQGHGQADALANAQGYDSGHHYPVGYNIPMIPVKSLPPSTTATIATNNNNYNNKPTTFETGPSPPRRQPSVGCSRCDATAQANAIANALGLGQIPTSNQGHNQYGGTYGSSSQQQHQPTNTLSVPLVLVNGPAHNNPPPQSLVPIKPQYPQQTLSIQPVSPPPRRDTVEIIVIEEPTANNAPGIGHNHHHQLGSYGTGNNHYQGNPFLNGAHSGAAANAGANSGSYGNPTGGYLASGGNNKYAGGSQCNVCQQQHQGGFSDQHHQNHGAYNGGSGLTNAQATANANANANVQSQNNGGGSYGNSPSDGGYTVLNGNHVNHGSYGNSKPENPYTVLNGNTVNHRPSGKLSYDSYGNPVNGGGAWGANAKADASATATASGNGNNNAPYGGNNSGRASASANANANASANGGNAKSSATADATASFDTRSGLVFSD